MIPWPSQGQPWLLDKISNLDRAGIGLSMATLVQALPHKERHKERTRRPVRKSELDEVSRWMIDPSPANSDTKHSGLVCQDRHQPICLVRQNHRHGAISEKDMCFFFNE